MGSVRKRGKTWHASWTDGQGRRRSKAVSTRKADAQAFLAAVEAAEVRARLGGYRMAMFADVADEYMNGVARLVYKPATLENYRSVLARHLLPAFGDRVVGEIATRDVEEYAVGRMDAGASAGTVTNEMMVLGVILRQSVKWGYATTVATRGALRPKAKQREITALSPGEVARLLGALDDRWRPLFATAALTGLRAGELAALTDVDVDFELHQLHVRRSLWKGRLQSPKTEKSIRDVDLAPTLERMLAEWLASPLRPRTREHFVFPSAKGRPLNMNTLKESVLYPALEEAGLPHMRMHDLRHTYASLLIAQGESLKYVQEMLGHTSIKVTADTYGHLLKETHRAAALRLDRAVFGGREVH